MRNLFYIWVCFLVCGCSSTNKLNSQQPKYDIDLQIKDTSIDKLNNIYLLDEENKIHRYTDDFTLLFTYANKLSGEILSIDATNPQKILAFIADFNRILTLDNTLAEINTIDLNTSDFLDVSAIARSNDNQIWIFDKVEQRLVKINPDGELLLESNRLSDYNLKDISASTILERDNIVALLDEQVGILLFDNFGHYMRTIEGSGLDNVHILNRNILFTNNGTMMIEDFKGINRREVMQVDQGLIVISNSKSYSVTQGGLNETVLFKTLMESIR